MSLENIFNISGSAMSAQSVRLNTVASNLANIDSASSSTGEVYRSRHPVFAAVDSGNPHSKSVQVVGIVESDRPLRKVYNPEHPLSDEEGYVSMPNINAVEQMADMLSGSKAYESNVSVIESAKDMMMRVLRLGQA